MVWLLLLQPEPASAIGGGLGTLALCTSYICLSSVSVTTLISLQQHQHGKLNKQQRQRVADSYFFCGVGSLKVATLRLAAAYLAG